MLTGPWMLRDTGYVANLARLDWWFNFPAALQRAYFYTIAYLL